MRARSKNISGGECPIESAREADYRRLACAVAAFKSETLLETSRRRTCRVSKHKDMSEGSRREQTLGGSKDAKSDSTRASSINLSLSRAHLLPVISAKQ